MGIQQANQSIFLPKLKSAPFKLKKEFLKILEDILNGPLQGLKGTLFEKSWEARIKTDIFWETDIQRARNKR